MINDRTPNLDLPLPHVSNDLSLDVERLRQALSAVDAAFGDPDEEVQTLTDGQLVVDLVALSSAAGSSVFLDGIRLNKTQWAVDAGAVTRLILTEPASAGQTIAVVRHRGGL